MQGPFPAVATQNDVLKLQSTRQLATWRVAVSTILRTRWCQQSTPPPNRRPFIPKISSERCQSPSLGQTHEAEHSQWWNSTFHQQRIFFYPMYPLFHLCRLIR